jgi:hypothetical protein
MVPAVDPELTARRNCAGMVADFRYGSEGIGKNWLARAFLVAPAMVLAVGFRLRCERALCIACQNALLECCNGRRSQNLHQYWLRLSLRGMPDDKVPALQVQAPAGQETDITGPGGFPDISAQFGIGKLDGQGGTEQDLLHL